MQTLGQAKKPAQSTHGINPFAQALVENESRTGKNKNTSPSTNQLFSEALSKTGGNIDSSYSQEDFLAKQQRELRKQSEREALRKKLHDQVNPVNNHEIFAAKKERDLKEIDQLKKDIALLISDIGSMQKEVELTLMTQISDPGTKGSYYKNFFAQLRSFVMLLRQKVKSARTWAQQMQSRKKKMAKRNGGGMVVDTQETAFVQSTMHQEKATAYTGG